MSKITSITTTKYRCSDGEEFTCSNSAEEHQGELDKKVRVVAGKSLTEWMKYIDEHPVYERYINSDHMNNPRLSILFHGIADALEAEKMK